MALYKGCDDKTLEKNGETKPYELFKEWNVKNALAALVNGVPIDLRAVMTEGGKVEPIAPDSAEGLSILRHSASHLMAHAITRLFPGAKFGVGPAIQDGFYYDVLFPRPITDEDLPAIEAEMKKISRERLPVERVEMASAEALELFSGDEFKAELINDIGEPTVTVYRQGDFQDLCRGPHAPDTGHIKHFRLMSLAGAYWRGNENNVMLTRIYGTVFADASALDAYLTMIEEAKLRDHRKLGRELDLFSFHQDGPGFPFFHPKGMTLMNAIVDFWRREHSRRGYSEIKTPLILDRGLWQRSGHWDHYRDNMYFTEIDEHPYAIKPMNCPGGILVYKTSKRSYRELPLRMAELGTVHRHERSGVLHGLMRVRCFTQDDAHLYCSEEQIADEVKGIIDLAKYIYGVFGFQFNVELSTRPDSFMGDPAMWELAEKQLQEVLEETGTPYVINPGDGAFYGPKIDFHLRDSIGRTWQCGTIQLDFQMPEKFDMTYVGSDGADHRPVMLHRTVLGSLERFIGILVEHYAGAFPYWIAPVQIRIIQVKPELESYSLEIEEKLKEMRVRFDRDARDEKLGKKIRDAQMEKVPYMLVIGAKEAESGKVSVRTRAGGDLGSRSMNELSAMLAAEFKPPVMS
ncbi:MAG: threonine--tRNA ligase [Synergistaceae bacterium]|nr:threonine--tRNA ligase [Synergistaceae bacterium]